MNEFSKCGQALTQTDIEKLESDLDTRLPEAMRDHYLRFNGGMPTLDWFPMTDDWDAIWVHEFLPVGTRAGQEPAIQSILLKLRAGPDILSSLIPFAVDPGGNIFSVDTDNGAVHYWLTDTYDETLTDAENRKKADRRLTGSFEQFVSSLVSEDEAFN